MSPAPGPRRGSGGAPRSRAGRRTTTARSHMDADPKANTVGKPFLWIRSRPTHGASIRSMATSTNGSRTVGTGPTSGRHRMVRPGPRVIALGVSCAAGHGNSRRSTYARRLAVGWRLQLTFGLSACALHDRYGADQHHPFGSQF